MFSKIKFICFVITMCFCLSVFIGCSSYETEDELIEALGTGKRTEAEFIKRMEVLLEKRSQ